jgi:hypothetical protein
MYVPSFRKSDTAVEGELRVCLSSLKGCNVGITEERDL